MYYVGCDQHKHYSQVVEKDQEGLTVNQQKLYHDDREGVKVYFDQLPKDSVIALEANGYEPWLCDLIQEAGLHLKLVHPKKTRAIAEEKIKTDKFSAGILADLLRADLICEAYQAPAEVRQQRYLGRYRLSLVRLRTTVKNKIHHLVDHLGLQLPDVTDLFGSAGRAYLQQLQLQPVYQRALKDYLHLVDTINQLLEPLERKLRSLSQDRCLPIQLLKTLPGVGPILSQIIFAETGDIGRFYSSSKYTAYLGIVPSLHQSGKIYRSGRITKEGNKYLRWAFIEAAQKAIHNDTYLAQFFSKISFKKGRNVAIVAVARKLATYAYWILKEQKPFEPRVISGRPRL